MRYLLVLLLLAGCAVDVIAPVGNTFSVHHTEVMMDRAMLKAREHCARMGMFPKHLGTDRVSVYGALSRFECVPG